MWICRYVGLLVWCIQFCHKLLRPAHGMTCPVQTVTPHRIESSPQCMQNAINAITFGWWKRLSAISRTNSGVSLRYGLYLMIPKINRIALENMQFHGRILPEVAIADNLFQYVDPRIRLKNSVPIHGMLQVNIIGKIFSQKPLKSQISIDCTCVLIFVVIFVQQYEHMKRSAFDEWSVYPFVRWDKIQWSVVANNLLLDYRNFPKNVT